jgi:hypothetical protein
MMNTHDDSLYNVDEDEAGGDEGEEYTEDYDETEEDDKTEDDL